MVTNPIPETPKQISRGKRDKEKQPHGDEVANALSESGTKSDGDSDEETPPKGPDDVFDEDDFTIIARVIYRKKTPSVALVSEVKNLFKLLRVTCMGDLETTASPESVLKAIQIPDDWELSGMHHARLVSFLEYASVRGQTLPSHLTAQDVSDVIESRKQEATPSSQGSVSTGQPGVSGLKYSLPAVKAFSGDDTAFWEWSDELHDTFGRGAIEDALTDPEFHLRDPKAAGIGFSTIAEALRKGTQKALPAMVKQKKKRAIAYDLYEALKEIFLTEENEAHYMSHSFEQLQALKLDDSITANEFISEWNLITTRMSRFHRCGGDAVFTNRLFLRTMLQQAIISDDYLEVRQYINKHPRESIEDYLREIRAQTSHKNSMQGLPPTNEEGQPVLSSRRTSFAPGTKPGKPDSSRNSSKFHKWNIPPIPLGFKEFMQKKLWTHLEQWREGANGTTMPIKDILWKYDIKRGPAIKGSAGGNGNPKKRARRSTAAEEDETDSKDHSNSSSPQEYQILSAHKRLRRMKDGRKIYAHEQISQGRTYQH